MDDFKNAVSDLIAELGGPVTYYHTLGNNPYDSNASSGVYDPATGQFTTPTYEYQLKGILLDLSLNRNGMGAKEGTLIQEGDKVLYAQPNSLMLERITPSGFFMENVAADRVKIGAVSYRVYNVKTINPTGADTIVCEFYLRR